MKYGSFIVFIRNDSAEMWGFMYGLTIGIGALRIMASTGVFVLVACTIKHSTSGDGRQPSMISTRKRSRCCSQNDLGTESYKGSQRTKKN